MAVVAGDDEAEVGVRHGREILAFARAALGQDAARIAETRARLVEQAGEAIAADAAGVAAHFNGINRVASGTGVKINEFFRMPEEIRDYMRERHGEHPAGVMIRT